MTELDQLLRQIADGDATPGLIERAKQLLLLDDRLPEDLRRIGLDDDEPDVAASALLGVLGLDDGLFGSLLGDAIRSELSEPVVEAAVRPSALTESLFAPAMDPPTVVTAEMLAAQEAAGLPEVAESVRFEAGEVDVSLDVLHALGVPVLDIASAVAVTAGEVDLAAEVATRLGSLPAPIAQALGQEAGEVDVAESVVAPLGDILVPVALAVRTEAGEVDLADAVVPLAVDVAMAVRAEAGDADVWPALAGAFEPGWVSGLFDGELSPVAHRIAARRLMRDSAANAELSAFADQGRTLRNAVVAQAGETPYIWAAVAPRIGIAEPEAVPGWEDGLVAEAVRASAGPVRVENGVMDRISRPVRVDTPLPAEPAPANRGGWRIAGMALAAAVLVSVIAGRLLPFGAIMDPGSFGADPASMDFAAAGEVQVEELSYDDEVNVMVTLPDEDGDRPLIIRINEEV